MRIKITHRLSFAEADRLIERYYEGLTTGTEEKLLQEFLSQRNLSERYEPEQAIFGYFDHKRQKKHFTLRPSVRWASVAAVAVLVVIGTYRFEIRNQSGYACIDGIRITDMQQVKSQALASLNDMSSSRNEVEEGLKNINDNGLMEQQLNVFSGLDK